MFLLGFHMLERFQSLISFIYPGANGLRVFLPAH